jgi:hypothetical protein
VADAVEALRQDVDQEAADELAGGECHDLLATIGTIVLPSEGDTGAVAGDQPAVGDGDAMGVARQIGQHGLWPAERTLRVDDPFGSAQRRQVSRERLRVGEGGMAAEELETAGLVGSSDLQRGFQDVVSAQPTIGRRPVRGGRGSSNRGVRR